MISLNEDVTATLIKIITMKKLKMTIMAAIGKIKEESKLCALSNYKVYSCLVNVVKKIISGITQYNFLNCRKVLLSSPHW